MKNILKKRYIVILLIAVSLSSFGIVGAEVLSENLWADTEMCNGVDPKTGLTCDEIKENPEQDVYYVVASSHQDDDIWKDSHQDPSTVRWDLAHTKFIVKYDADEIPRREFGLDGALGNPMNNEEIQVYLRDPLNGFYFDENAPIIDPLLPPEIILPIEPEVPPITEEPPIVEEPVVPEPVDPTIPTDPTDPTGPIEPEPVDPPVVAPDEPPVEEDAGGDVAGASDGSEEEVGGENPPSEEGTDPESGEI